MAHEHHRPCLRVAAIAAQVGATQRMGLAAVSAVWECPHAALGTLHAAAVVVCRATGGVGAAPSLPGLPAHLFRAVGGPGAGQLVRPGSAPQCGGSLAARRAVAAPQGGVHALVAGASGALVAVAAARPAARRAEPVRRQVRSALGRPVHPVSAAPSHAQAEAALVTLHRPPWGAALAKSLNAQCDHLLVYLLDYYQGVARTAPEGCWRDFRLRLGHGRHPGSEQRWERAALVWAIHHNFEPARWRCERRRHYTCTARKCRCRHPGQSALPVAGVPPGERSYLDALGVQTPTEPLLIVPTRHRAAGGEAWAQAD